MNNQIEILRKLRIFLLAGIGDLSIDELNKIPPGYNNNIVWNLGHLVASQQGLCYLRAGLVPAIDENFILAYKSGSKPERFVDNRELEIIKDLLFSSLDQFEIDLANQAFPQYIAWTTRYGTEVTNINDALNFLPFHEGLHMGIITSLKRVVKK